MLSFLLFLFTHFLILSVNLSLSSCPITDLSLPSLSPHITTKFAPNPYSMVDSMEDIRYIPYKGGCSYYGDVESQPLKASRAGEMAHSTYCCCRGPGLVPNTQHNCL